MYGDGPGPVDVTQVTVFAALSQSAVPVLVQPRRGNDPRAGFGGGTLFGDGP